MTDCLKLIIPEFSDYLNENYVKVTEKCLINSDNILYNYHDTFFDKIDAMNNSLIHINNKIWTCMYLATGNEIYYNEHYMNSVLNNETSVVEGFKCMQEVTIIRHKL